MSIRRRKKTRSFTQIDNAALRNPSLSLKAKGLLAVMMSCPEDWQFYMDWLQLQSSDGRESHQTAMKELERAGYVVREKIQGKGGKFSGWEYLVDDELPEGQTAAGKPTNGKAVCRSADERENRQTGKPSDGKPAASNTDLTNTDLHKNGGVSNVIDNAREAAPASPPARPNLVPHTTTGSAAQQSVAPDCSPSSLHHIPPGGGVALATQEVPSPFSDEDFAELFGPKPAEVTSGEKVPGGAAAADAPCWPGNGPTALSVAYPAPIPQDELLSRPAAPLVSEIGSALKTLTGGAQRFEALVEQPTPSGGLDRELWLRLTAAEIQGVKVAAQHEARAGSAPFTTLVIRGLDAVIGAPTRKSAVQGEPLAGGAAYAPAKRLTVPEDERLAEGEGLYRVGATWLKKGSGEGVQITGKDGAKMVLSNGEALLAYELGRRYEFQGASAGGALELDDPYQVSDSGKVC